MEWEGDGGVVWEGRVWKGWGRVECGKGGGHTVKLAHQLVNTDRTCAYVCTMYIANFVYFAFVVFVCIFCVCCCLLFVHV